MSCDELLSEECRPAVWVPFSVEVRPEGDTLELVATGHLDGWTAGALLRTLIAACEQPYHEVHLDLRQAEVSEDADQVLAHCRAFADSRRMQVRVSGPLVDPADDPLTELPAAGR